MVELIYGELVFDKMGSNIQIDLRFHSRSSDPYSKG